MRILLVLVCFFPFVGKTATINDTLYIVSGNLSFNDGNSFPAITLSSTNSFNESSEILIYQQGDNINLTIINTDLASHSISIDNLANYGTISSGDTVTQSFTLSVAGVFRYFDILNSPFNEYLGLNGFIHVKATGDNVPYFYWDVREHKDSWNSMILGGSNPALTQYDPNYFTINGNSEPDINDDPLARVTGNVGNELRIVMVNNGLSIHSMHFHGYHSTVINNSKDPSHIGRSKDTFPLYPKEYLIISMTPDKTGEYPVHDHNLVAVTGGGIYHAGMFTTLLIAP